MRNTASSLSHWILTMHDMLFKGLRCPAGIKTRHKKKQQQSSISKIYLWMDSLY